jgi:hypothetical protein
LKRKKKAPRNEQEKSANEEKSALKVPKARGKKRKLKRKDKDSSY